MDQKQLSLVTTLVGAAPTRVGRLTGGCVGEVYRVTWADGRDAVVKVDDSQTPRLSLEGKMLEYLADHTTLPVPRVWHNSDRLLVMDFLPGASYFDEAAEHHAAALLAALHSIEAPAFGFEQDTLIGGLHQPNPWTARWVDFYRDHRLLFMGEEAARAGRLSQVLLRRLETFCTKLNELLDEPKRPALLHGDVWSANVLATGGRITGFLDPAIYFGHPEVELAFIRLFHTFGQAFMRRYTELVPIAAGFDRRVPIYQLYPLLVHVRLFGGGYVQSVDRILQQMGFR